VQTLLLTLFLAMLTPSERTRTSKDRYSTLGLIKICTDAFTMPPRFGTYLSCPFCINFNLAHISTCSQTGKFVHNLLSEQAEACVYSIIGKQFENYFLKCGGSITFLKGEQHDHVLQVFSCLAPALAHMNAEPTISVQSLFQSMKQQNAIFPQ
jgi:hypothetical protein